MEGVNYTKRPLPIGSELTFSFVFVGTTKHSPNHVSFLEGYFVDTSVVVALGYSLFRCCLYAGFFPDFVYEIKLLFEVFGVVVQIVDTPSTLLYTHEHPFLV